MIPYLIEQHGKGEFPLDKIVKFYPVEDYETAFKDIKSGKALKAVLLWK